MTIQISCGCKDENYCDYHQEVRQRLNSLRTKNYRILQGQLWIGPVFLSVEAAQGWAMVHVTGFYSVKSYTA
jgi:hypothetical protein